MKQKKKIVIRLNALYLATQIVIGSLTGIVLVKSHFTYVPKEREVISENTFEDNEVIISDSESLKIVAKLEKSLKEDLDEENDNVLLLSAIYNNDNLTKKEKDILYCLLDYFNDNPYINKEKVYHELRNLNIQFSFRKHVEEDKAVLAMYLSQFRDIVHFEIFPKDSTRAHENIHCVSRIQNLPKWFNEGMCELISLEYFEEEPFLEMDSYCNEIKVIKFLCELVGSDTVLKAYTLDDMNIIIDELSKIYGEKEDYKEAFEMFEWGLSTKEEDIPEIENMHEVIDRTFSLFNECYKKKKETTENLPTLVYTYKDFLLLFIQDPELDLSNYVLCKGYISSELKKDFGDGFIVKKDEYLGRNFNLTKE